MKIGKVKKITKRPDVIPVKLPKPKPIPAPDIFQPKKEPARPAGWHCNPVKGNQ